MGCSVSLRSPKRNARKIFHDGTRLSLIAEVGEALSLCALPKIDAVLSLCAQTCPTIEENQQLRGKQVDSWTGPFPGIRKRR
ncbi:hypothetical protein L2E82_39713 [Cichorium intybus]|uniref:Uncharacterized protein n=1 Tax=Cichorium intybus TaxID=13427 RepID=A0ACB9AJS4_CICIN|nr:hypothetical protein L2E82_39713 [Cichorium intybus]